MRKQIWIIFIVALVICLLLLLLTAPWSRKAVLPEYGETVTDQQPPPSQASRPHAVESAKKATAPASAPELAAQMARRRTPEASNEMQERALATWRAPIDFFGKVVDENSTSVAGANVIFSWSETPAVEGEQKATTSSDAAGLFSLRGKHGPSLVVWVSKEGYYASRGGQRGFDYMGHEISPDPQNPVIFSLRKKGQPEPLIHIAGIGLHTMRDFLLAGDGKPTEVSLRDGRLTSTGQGDLKVEFQAGESFAPSKATWRCRVTIPGGGLVPTEEEFPFLAPQDSYKEAEELSITTTNWAEQLNKQYYVKLRDGNFGRIKLRIIGVPGRAYFRMESFLNPSGSRNLEPAN